jgi:DNA-binding transcriptional LysR family regulator
MPSGPSLADVDRIPAVDLRRLEAFAKVAELGSFSRAADVLFLTQPTVSEHVRSLEDELGVQLLDRLGRRASPTRAGHLLLDYARRILGLTLEARQAIDRLQGRMGGELRIGGSTIPGEYIVPALIGQFRGKHPDVSVSLLIGSSRQVNEWVDTGLVELGVAGARGAQRALDSRELMPDDLVVVMSPDHPWAARATVTADLLRHEPLIVRERGSGSREAFEQALDGIGLDLSSFRIAGEMGSTQAVKQGVRAGVGVAVISRRAVEDECRAGLLRCVEVEGVQVTRMFYLVTHRDRTRSPLAEAFLSFVEGVAPALASPRRP